jgi:transposase
MPKLPVSVSETDFNEYILPHLTHKANHNRQKVSYHYIFNAIIYVLKTGCPWRMLKPDDGLVTDVTHGLV